MWTDSGMFEMKLDATGPVHSILEALSLSHREREREREGGREGGRERERERER